jgi:hypothetical protein
MLSRCGRDRHTKIRYRWNLYRPPNLLAVQYKEQVARMSECDMRER